MFAEILDLARLPAREETVEVSLLDLTQLVDPESTAARFLTLRERQEYAQMRHPSRRREWLGARVCLKSMLLRRRSVSAPTECEILKDASGRPWVSFAPGRPVNAVFDCSLSHKGRFAGACASSVADTRVGVDVEEISPRLLRLAGVFAGDRHSLVRPRPPEERLALLWAVKEACAKAMGGGIGMALRDITCEETASGQHQVRTDEGLEFQVRDFLHDGYIIAMCLRTEEVHRQGKGR